MLRKPMLDGLRVEAQAPTYAVMGDLAPFHERIEVPPRDFEVCADFVTVQKLRRFRRARCRRGTLP